MGQWGKQGPPFCQPLSLPAAAGDVAGRGPCTLPRGDEGQDLASGVAIARKQAAQLWLAAKVAFRVAAPSGHHRLPF